MERDQSATIRMLVVALLVALVAIVALSLALCSRMADQGSGQASSATQATAQQESAGAQQNEGAGEKASSGAQDAASSEQGDWDDTVADEGDASETGTTSGGAADAASAQSDGSASASDANANAAESSGENAAQASKQASIDENGTYTSKDEVALYIHTYGHLPSNFVSKTKARKAGWVAKEGNLDKVLPGMSIGGSEFYNNDGQLPDAEGRTWTECDINYQGGFRGAERIVFSNDGLIFYTNDHYETFEQLY